MDSISLNRVAGGVSADSGLSAASARADPPSTMADPPSRRHVSAATLTTTAEKTTKNSVNPELTPKATATATRVSGCQAADAARPAGWRGRCPLSRGSIGRGCSTQRSVEVEEARSGIRFTAALHRDAATTNGSVVSSSEA
ncbi:MAG: hypothetical protein EA404_03045 [Spirochaetaceae bacterium]|nr:MAG: hypothetical protein EA404_03045 [Spirochaetaceae bacterium]